MMGKCREKNLIPTVIPGCLSNKQNANEKSSAENKIL